MDLPQVKAAVKAWEKSFKALYDREPTKDDIKRDASGVVEQYALYRKLSKAGSSSQQASSSSASYHSRQFTGEPSHITPRIIPTSQYPTTPTPPPRRPSSSVESNGHGKAEPFKDRKRTASKAALNPSSPPPSSSRPSFITPKKPRPSGYSGPVYDPNPVNPFAVSPPKPPTSLASQSGPSTSPFIHATSPRKLKEVLQLNSLRKVRERDGMGSPLKEITPRTRARKRLKGEAVEDTPMKDRVPRRKRGERGIEMGKEAMLVESQDDEADDDEFGPSPMKALGGGNRTFTSLLVEAEIEAAPVHGVRKGKGKERGNRGRPSEMLGLFGKVPRGREKGERAQVTKQPSTPAAPRHEEGVVSPQSASDPPENSTAPVHENPRSTDEADSSEELSTPAPDPLLEAAASQVSPSKPSVPTRTISLSDDEEDQWDPEGGRARRTVVIVPTRRAARAWSDDDLVHDDVDDDEAEDEVEAEEEEAAVPPLVEGTTATSTTHPSSPTTASLAPPLLWMLSLHSPSSSSKQSRLADLRVKAIFNPTDAAKLRAMKRGQEVYLPGEGGDEEADEKVMDAYAMGGEGQDEGGGEGVDDWESEDEGWKRASVGMDDDEGDW